MTKIVKWANTDLTFSHASKTILDEKISLNVSRRLARPYRDGKASRCWCRKSCRKGGIGFDDAFPFSSGRSRDGRPFQRRLFLTTGIPYLCG